MAPDATFKTILVPSQAVIHDKSSKATDNRGRFSRNPLPVAAMCAVCPLFILGSTTRSKPRKNTSDVARVSKALLAGPDPGRLSDTGPLAHVPSSPDVTCSSPRRLSIQAKLRSGSSTDLVSSGTSSGGVLGTV